MSMAIGCIIPTIPISRPLPIIFIVIVICSSLFPIYDKFFDYFLHGYNDSSLSSSIFRHTTIHMYNLSCSFPTSFYHLVSLRTQISMFLFSNSWKTSSCFVLKTSTLKITTFLDLFFSIYRNRLNSLVFRVDLSNL